MRWLLLKEDDGGREKETNRKAIFIGVMMDILATLFGV